MKFNDILTQVSPRLKAAEACDRVEYAIGQHFLPVVLCAAIVTLSGHYWVGAAVFGLAILIGITSFLLNWIADRLNLKAQDTWLSHVNSVNWSNAQGQAVEILSISSNGRMAILQHGEHTLVNYPTSILRPLNNPAAAEMLPPEGEVGFPPKFESMLKAKWQTPNGDVGTIIGFDFFSLDERRMKFTLLLESGREQTVCQTQVRELPVEG